LDRSGGEGASGRGSKKLLRNSQRKEILAFSAVLHRKIIGRGSWEGRKKPPAPVRYDLKGVQMNASSKNRAVITFEKFTVPEEHLAS